MQNAKSLQLLSIAARAGRLLHGESDCLEAVRAERARVLMLDRDASENTQKRFRDACTYHRVPLWIFDATGMDLPAAVGRTGNKTFALTDVGFAKKLIYLEKTERTKPPPEAETALAASKQQGVEV